jgi:uncharacterized membrane protein
MTMLKLLSLFIMSAFYIFAGISHFRKPKFYTSITPPWVPAPEKVNTLVGVIEIVLGTALLFSATQYYAAYCIIILLIAVFPANLYHYQLAKIKQKQEIATLLRLPIQILLIYWAYSFL